MCGVTALRGHGVWGYCLKRKRPLRSLLHICPCCLDKGSDACYSEELFQKRLFVLTGYANGNDRLGLEVLMALQEAVTKLDHPPSELCAEGGCDIWWCLGRCPL